MLSRSNTPEIKNLRAFVEAARFESFTQAAIELDLTQGAISKQVRELETQLRVALFERVKRRIVLTEAGRRFLPEAREVISRLEHAAYDVMALEGTRQVLSIASLPTFGTRWLIPRLSRFTRLHPGLQINVASRDQPFDFENEPFDLAIHYGAPVWPRAQCSYLCSEQVIPVMSSTLATSLGLKTLDQRQELLMSADRPPLLHLTGRPTMWSQWFARQGDTGVNALQGQRYDQFSFIISAVLAGLGIALVPTYLIEPELAEGSLCLLARAPMQTAMSYHVAVPLGRAQSELCLSFQAWLQGEVGNQPTSPPEPAPRHDAIADGHITG